MTLLLYTYDFSPDISEIDPCYPDPCENDGECFPQIDTMNTTQVVGVPVVCECPPGYAGRFCDEGK